MLLWVGLDISPLDDLPQVCDVLCIVVCRYSVVNEPITHKTKRLTENKETKQLTMIDNLPTSRGQCLLSSESDNESSKAMTNPATAALEKISGLPQRERRQQRNRALSDDTYSDSELETKRNHVFDMTELFNVSLPLEGSLEFPRIDWTPEEDENDSKKRFASKRSTSYEDSCLALPKSSLPITRSSSTTSLLKSSLGKRHRQLNARCSKRLVRSIAMNSNLSLLETSSLLRLDHDACIVASNFYDQTIYPSKLEDHTRSTAIKLHECLKILEKSELYSSRHFAKKPRGGQQA